MPEINVVVIDNISFILRTSDIRIRTTTSIGRTNIIFGILINLMMINIILFIDAARLYTTSA
jgi:hypothetical protein